VPLVAAAVCPHPPLLLPSVAAGAASELDDLRTACSSAIDRVFAAGPDVVVLVGGGASARFAGDDFGSFDTFGVRETYSLGGIDALAVGARMPLSLAVGAWLLRERDTGPQRIGLSVPAGTTAESCRSLGADLASRPDRVGLIIMGDGSACHGEKSPGYADPRAEPFDDSVAKALATADPVALLELDASIADQLLVAGRAPWQVLAGAATGASWRGEVLYHAAPYGVGYLVASWLPK
jgi:hypothetical protein